MSAKKSIVLLLAFVLSLFTFAACDKEESESKTLQLNYSTYMLTVGETFTLSAVKSESGETPSFSSDNAEIASVASDGTVTGISVGQAVITVAVGEETARCVVNVAAENDGKGLSFFAKSVTLRVGGDSRKLYVMYDGKIVENGVSYSAENEAIATVSENGVVTATGKGVSSVTAAYKELTAVCTVTVKSFNSVKFEESILYLKKDEQKSIEVNAYDGLELDLVENPDIEFTVADTSIAEIVRESGAYQLKAKGSGTTTLTAKYADSSATALVSVAKSIFTCEELIENASSSGVYLIMENDIVMEGDAATWDSTSGPYSIIPTFNGCLDGNGHKLTITHTLKNSKHAKHNVGFIGNIAAGAVIKNLNIYGEIGQYDYGVGGSTPTGCHSGLGIYSRAALLAFHNSGTIENCYVKGMIKTNKAGNLGTGAGLVFVNTASGVIRNVISDIVKAADNTREVPQMYGFAVSNQGGRIENCIMISNKNNGTVFGWMSGNIGTSADAPSWGKGFPTNDVVGFPSDYMNTVNQPDEGRRNCSLFISYLDLLTENGTGKTDKFANDLFVKSEFAEIKAGDARASFTDGWQFHRNELVFFDTVVYTTNEQ